MAFITRGNCITSLEVDCWLCSYTSYNKNGLWCIRYPKIEKITFFEICGEFKTDFQAINNKLEVYQYKSEAFNTKQKIVIKNLRKEIRDLKKIKAKLHKKGCKGKLIL
jgi:hypothetical protein